MKILPLSLSATLLVFTSGCVSFSPAIDWQNSVNQHINQLGYRNWIVVAEASFPAHNRSGIRHVTTEAEIPEVVDYVLNAIESTQHVRPNIYLTREIRAVDNDFAPGIDQMNDQIRHSLHSLETTEVDQQSLITLLQSANDSYDVLVIRTKTALPYASVFIELQPGYWDAESEDRLRERIRREKLDQAIRRN